MLQILKKKETKKIDYFNLFGNIKFHEVENGKRNSNGIKETTTILEKEKKFISILKVSPINTDFLTEEDISYLTEKLNSLFNLFDSLGIYIYKEPVNYDQYIEYHESIRNNCKNAVIERKQNNFLKYIKEKSENKKSNKYFYIRIEKNSIKDFKISFELIAKAFYDALLDVEFCNKEDILCLIYKRIFKEEFFKKGKITEDDVIPENAVDYKGLYQIIEGKYHKQLVLSYYDIEIKAYSWLKDLIDIDEDINISINCKKINPANLTESLNKKISSLKFTIENSNLKESEKNQKETELETSRNIVKNIASSTLSIFDTEIIFDIEAISEEELTKTVQSLKQNIKTQGFKSMEILRKRFNGFISTLPLGDSLDYCWNLTSMDIASIIPFDNNNYFDEKGIIIGKNPTNQIPYSLDIFNTKYFNPHMYILGMSGSGKTYTITTITERIKPFVETIIKFDIAGVLHTSDSTRYVFSSEGNVVINPFFIRYKTKNALESATLNVLEFFKDVANFKSSQLDLIAKYIKITYLSNGLTDTGFTDKYKETTFTDFAKVSIYKKMKLEELKIISIKELTSIEIDIKNADIKTEEGKQKAIELQEKKIEINNTIKQAEEEIADIEYILSEMNSFIKGIYSKMFNGKNNFEYGKDTVLDLSKLEKIMRGPVFRLLINDTWHYCIKDGTRDKNSNIPLKMVVFDEEHEFLDDELLLKFISKKFAKQGRKYGIATIHASQDFNDSAQNIEAQAILSNCNFKIILRIGDNDYDSVKRYFRFSDKEIREITGSSLTQKIISKGRGIFVVDNLHLPYQSEGSEMENKEIKNTLDLFEEGESEDEKIFN